MNTKNAPARCGRLLLGLAAVAALQTAETFAEDDAPALNPQELLNITKQQRHPPHLDRNTLLIFPSTLAGMSLKAVKLAEKPDAPDRLLYGPDLPNGISAEVEIRKLQLPAKDGIESPELKRAFNNALAGFSVLSSKGVFKKLAFGPRRSIELSSGQTGRSLSALVAKVSFEINDAGRQDIYLLDSVYNGCLLKVLFNVKDDKNSDERFEAFSKAFSGLLFRGSSTCVAPQTKEAVLAAVKALEEDPLATGVLAAQAIVVFARDSEDVSVGLAPSVLPWIVEGERLKHQDLLMAAFIGGDIRKQLLDAKIEDSPLDGLRCAIKVYKRIQQEEPAFRSPAIDRLVKLEKEGKLGEAFTSENQTPQQKKLPSK